MKRFFNFDQLVAVTLLVLLCSSAAFAQDITVPRGEKETSPSGLTGAGEGGSGTRAAKPGGADGLGNPILGGERRPLYRLQPSDVVEISSPQIGAFKTTVGSYQPAAH